MREILDQLEARRQAARLGGGKPAGRPLGSAAAKPASQPSIPRAS